MRRTGAALGAVGLFGAAGLLGGCGGGGSTSSSSRPSSTPPAPVRPAAVIRLTSPAFSAASPIPVRFTCDGRDVSPPLRWSQVPPGTRRLQLVMRDPDAPGGNFIHWSISLPPGTDALTTGHVPPRSISGRNGYGTVGYRGPCPPAGQRHNYVLTLSAQAGAQTLASGTLTATYARR